MADMNALNAIADEAQKQSQQQAPPESDDGSCKMCGAMVQHQDPDKMKAFMANNPFGK